MRWLRLGALLTIGLIVALLAFAWQSLQQRESGDAIRAKAEQRMEQIEAEAERLENATR